MPTMYEILGVTPDADEATLKKAYRAKAAKHHPDKGGRAEDMSAINEAMDILLDAERRRRYDQTGDTSIPRSAEQTQAAKAEQGLIVLLASILGMEDEFPGNIVQNMRERVTASTNAMNRQITKYERGIEKIAKLRKRLSGPFVEDLLNQQEAELNAQIKACRDQIEVDGQVQEMIGKYADTWEASAADADLKPPPREMLEAMASLMQQKARNRAGMFGT